MIYKSFTEMPVWQKVLKLAADVFTLTLNLPRSEDYGLASQIRKSSIGVAACIAEGFDRNTKKDKSNFLWHVAHYLKHRIIFFMPTKLGILSLKSQISSSMNIMNLFLN